MSQFVWGTKAEEFYLSEGGERYWERNLPRLGQESYARSRSVRSLCSPGVGASSWLEVGCGQGHNLSSHDVGVDLDPRNLHGLWRRDIVGLIGNARWLPFIPSRSFPVVFCVGLLMHMADGLWQQAFREMERIAVDYVIAGEYDGPVEKDRLWEGESGLLWERPYLGLVSTEFPGLKLNEQTHLAPPFDEDVVFFVWRKLR